MSERYPIYDLEVTLGQQLEEESTDGMLPKNWYRHPELGLCLFKVGELLPGITMDWTEIVCHRIAEIIGLPVARYELATGYVAGSSQRYDGTISINFIYSKLSTTRTFAYSTTRQANLRLTPKILAVPPPVVMPL
jgi:hypothetical protein